MAKVADLCVAFAAQPDVTSAREVVLFVPLASTGPLQLGMGQHFRCTTS